MTSSTSKAYDFLEPSSHAGDLGMLGNYRILGELGRGGMGFVFQAIDTVLQRPVALKVMNKRIAATPHSRERFIQEARAMAAVHHDNVVVIFEVDQVGSTPFMAMEMLKGQTLEDINAKREPHDYETIIAYAKQICHGLAAAHAKGIVHRDIKPANIWLEENTNRIKILDFGLALAHTSVDELAAVGSVAGTPAYLAPEQARSDPLDDRTDLYSVGVVLYELAAARRPFSNPVLGQLLVSVLVHEPPPLRDFNPNIPQPLADLIHRLLKKESQDRPESAVSLLKEFEKAAVECEAKSEVALSINKLAESLKEVVDKQDSGVIDVDPAEFVEEVPAYDPLSMPPPTEYPSPVVIPAAVTQQVAAAGPAMGRPQNPRSQNPRKAKQTAANDSTNYLPWIGGGVGIAVAIIGVMAWAFTRPDPSPVVVANNTPATQPTLTTSPTANPQSVAAAKPNTAKQTNDPSPQETQSKPNQNQGKQAPEKQGTNKQANGGKKRKNKKGNQPNNGGASNGKSNQFNQPNPAPMDSDPPPSASPIESSTSMAALQPLDSRPESNPDMVAMSKPSLESDDSMANENGQPEPVTRDVKISTDAGIGADSSVRRGSSRESMGKDPNIGVHTRAGKELQHAYMRFDLESGSFSRDNLQKAALVLWTTDNQVPEGANLRLYGIDSEVAEKWQEEGNQGIVWTNSISKVGLDSLPVLGEWQTSDAVVAQKTNIIFATDELTDFLKQASNKSVTLIISGGREDNSAIRFTSKEKAPANAPTLWLKLPINDG